MSTTTQLEIENSSAFRLTQALLIYQSERVHTDHNGKTSGARTAVTVHPVVNGKIMEGQPISRGAVEELAAALGRNLAAGWLPANLVSLGFGTMAWFCPAGRRRIWFKPDGRFDGGDQVDNSHTKAALKLNGKFVHHPPLLFVATPGNLAVFALAKNERPLAETGVYRAPYWNLWKDGKMCAGNRAMPEQPLPSSIAQYEAAFFQSAFTHTNLVKVCHHPKGHSGFWSELATLKEVPAGYWSKNLVPLKHNLTQVIAGKLKDN